MWIVDDDGDMFNTDHYKICVYEFGLIYFFSDFQNKTFDIFKVEGTDIEVQARYYDLVEKLTGERLDA